MKNILFYLKKGCLVLFTGISMNVAAQTFTASASGNWTDPNTWGGSAAPTEIGLLQNVVIPSGFTVNLDVDVTVNSLLSTIDVDGNLEGTQTIFIESGSITGDGDITAKRLEFNSALALMTFTGDLTVDELLLNGPALLITSDVEINDSLLLSDGSISINGSGSLKLMAGAMIVRDGGTLTVNGGIFSSEAEYDVRYIGGNKTSGIELGSTSIANVELILDDVNNTLTLANDLDVNGTLTITAGRLVVAANTLELKGTISINGGSYITTSAASELIVKAEDLNAGLSFSPGSVIGELEIDVSGGKVMLNSDLALADELRLISGSLSIENAVVFTANAGSIIKVMGGKLEKNGGHFNGSAAYDASYSGGDHTAGLELRGSGLANVMIALDDTENQLQLDSHANIHGKLQLTKGTLHINGQHLILSGTLDASRDARFAGNENSSLTLELTAISDDTLWFADDDNELAELTINPVNDANIVLGTDLNIHDELILTNGKLDIANRMLMLTSSASITQTNEDSYIVTSGDGMLQMNLNNSGPYVLFPISTASGYSPAYIQQTSSGTGGDFKVRVMHGVYDYGTGGTNYAQTRAAVNRTWIIDAADGVNVNMNLKLGWLATAEVNGFNRSEAFLAQYTDENWDRGTAVAATSGAMNTYEIKRDGLSSATIFAVSDTNTRLSIDNITSTVSINLYPNPANDFISIETNDAENYTYELSDASGRIIATFNSTIDKTIDLRALDAGYYFIKATGTTNGNIGIGRFVKY